ncbi:MAG TPA: hydroxymethylbilane synthase [candidate division Zixibacteria bacterium]|nr:hydroxymethylbilane synthase [candidate division Zixibacteria bacterium]HER00033.1 hydroxymethylbilane synthase [candidate division Zixibacteria bacterium]
MLKIATRGSRLAMRQSGMIRDMLLEKAGLEAELMVVRTAGDVIQNKPLSEVKGAGFFTKEIEQALFDGRADIAVHSLKDLPIQQPPGIDVVAIAERENPSEALLTRTENIDDSRPLNLNEGLTIGTSAIRRKAQIRALRPDLKVKDLRGNVTTRLEKLREGEYDAIIIAYAGLKRVGVEIDDLELRVLKRDEFVPAPAQGALAVETRIKDYDVASRAAKINHADTKSAVDAERRLLLLCGGGCHLPLGANLTRAEEGWVMTVFWSYLLPDKTEKYLRAKISSEDFDQLVEESYAYIKSTEISDLLNFKGRSKDLPRKLLITRPSEKTDELGEKLAAKDIELIPYPVQSLRKNFDEKEWIDIEQEFEAYEYIILTSANAVQFFKEILEDSDIAPEKYSHKKIATVGVKTAEACSEAFPDSEIIVSHISTGAGLGAHLLDYRKGKALFPCAREAGHDLQRVLGDAGWHVRRFEIYESIPEKKENLPDVNPGEVAYYCFTSPLAAEYTFDKIDLPENSIIISIGPRTSEKIKKSGYKVDWELPNSNLEWLWQVL